MCDRKDDPLPMHMMPREFWEQAVFLVEVLHYSRGGGNLFSLLSMQMQRYRMDGPPTLNKLLRQNLPSLELWLRKRRMSNVLLRIVAFTMQREVEEQKEKGTYYSCKYRIRREHEGAVIGSMYITVPLLIEPRTRDTQELVH